MSMIVSCPVALLLEIETTVERAKKDAENELNVLGMFKNQEIVLFLAKKFFYFILLQSRCESFRPKSVCHG